MLLSILKFFSFVVILINFTACGGGGNSTNSEYSVHEITPSSEFYGDDPTFSPSQVVFFQPSSPLEKDAVVKATDEFGIEIDVVGQADGSGMLLLPSDIVSGKYSLKIANDTLNLNIIPISYPEDSQLYVSNYLNDLNNSLETLITSQGDSTDPTLVQLLTDMQEQETKLNSLTEAEVSRIARLLYANADGLFSNSVSIANSQFIYSAQFNSQECTSAKIGFVATVVATVSFSAVVAAEPTQIGKIIFAGAFSYALYNLSNETELVINKCPKAVITSLVRSLSSSSVDSFSNTAKINVGSQRIHYADAVSIASSGNITFSDGVTKSFSVEIEEEPESDLKLVINKIKVLVSTATSYLPAGFISDDLIAKVNNLGLPKKRDVTNDVAFEQVNLTDISCTGDALGYMCKFPNNGTIYSEPVNFQFNLSHEDLAEPLTQSATLSPGNLPVIDDQTFNVKPGHGQVNRINIQVAENTNSPDYELTKVLGFQLVSRPSYGVILNEFIELGVFDYAADITDDMPEMVTFEVRAWNKYGYSAPATITLKLANLSFEGIWKEISSDYYDANNPDFLVIDNRGATTFYYNNPSYDLGKCISSTDRGIIDSNNQLDGDGLSTFSLLIDGKLLETNDKNGNYTYILTNALEGKCLTPVSTGF